MFQRFTSLFFSDSSTVEVIEEPKPFVSKEEEEDGWLIIDLPGEKHWRKLLASHITVLKLQNGRSVTSCILKKWCTGEKRNKERLEHK